MIFKRFKTPREAYLWISQHATVCTAQHPRTKLWHGIDVVLRSPITAGFENRDDAIRAAREYVAAGFACGMESRRSWTAESLSRASG